LGLQAGHEVKVTFTSQVVPVCRGIMSTLCGTLTEDQTEQDVMEIFRAFYADDVFVRVLGSTAPVSSSHVRVTNYCNLVVSVDPRLRRLRIVSYIDNLVKGQAGSALQNMNLLFSFAENAGLDCPSMYP
jgi:N-acetyl-gamma-glutamyl-phosphate reductase